MSNPRTLQHSFAGGVQSPDMFMRHDDPVARAGAAELKNAVSWPHGGAVRRPGSRLVIKAKDSTKRVCLRSFVFSPTDSVVVQASRAVVSGREIGHFRFHTQGGTVLYARPSDYVASLSISSMSLVTHEADFGVAHGFTTGDPVVIQLSPSTSVTVVAGSPGVCTVASASTLLAHGTPIVFSATTMPSGLTAERIYYAHLPVGNNFGVSEVRFGPAIAIGSAGVGVLIAAKPEFSGATVPYPITTVLYAIDTGATQIQFALTKADALASVNLTLASVGMGTRRVHYAYEAGDLAHDTGLNLDFYCMKRPWGVPGSDFIRPPDFQGHATTDLTYWCQLPGKLSSVTFNLTTDRVLWVAHGLAAGTFVTFTGSPLPTGLTAGTVYYVRNPATNDFQVSASPAGPIVDLGGAPSGCEALADAVYEVPHYFTEDELFALTTAQSNDVISLASARRPFSELRRYGPTRWVLSEPIFRALVDPPTNLLATATFGRGMKLTAISGAGVFTTADPHHFAAGEPVHLTGFTDTNFGDGFYVVESIGALAVTLQRVEDGTTAVPSAPSGPFDARLRSSSSSADATNTYVVTAIDANGEETAASSPVTVTNNLFVDGASNALSWGGSAGAVRYRVYKRQSGLYGLIGESDDTTFVDDSIGPDLSVVPPRLDDSLLRFREVTVDLTTDSILWPSHGLADGAPIVFDTNSALPTGIEVGISYYVVNASPDTFQVSATSGGAAINLTNTPRAPSGITLAKVGFFPGAVGYYEGRRIFSGSLQLPQDVWATESGTESGLSYSLPVTDADRIHRRAAARDGSPVRHVLPMGRLVLLSGSTEFVVLPLSADTLTPDSFAVRARTHVGTDLAQPALVGASALFAGARGGHPFELVVGDQGSVATEDAGVRASHLFDGLSIVQLAFGRAPIPVVWAVSSGGGLLGLTFVPEQQVRAWHHHDTAGVVESVAVVPEGTEDHVYLVVRRTIDGASVRFVERLAGQLETTYADEFHVDCGVTYVGAATTQVRADHLGTTTVAVWADGVPYTLPLVAGLLTLPVAASTVQFGLPFTTRVRTVPITLPLDAAGRGRAHGIAKAWALLRNSGAFQVAPYRPENPVALTTVAPRFGTVHNGEAEITVPPALTTDGQLVLELSTAAPLRLTGLVFQVAVGA